MSRAILLAFALLMAILVGSARSSLDVIPAASVPVALSGVTVVASGNLPGSSGSAADQSGTTALPTATTIPPACGPLPCVAYERPQGTVAPRSVAKRILTRERVQRASTGLVRASWYATGGPGLYAALPGPWRDGRLVVVCGFTGGVSRCATAPVVTSCICTGPPPKAIDLSPALFEAVSGWTARERELRGIVMVTIEMLR